MEKLWVVRNNNGEYLETFLNDKIIGLNWCPSINLVNKNLTEIKNILCEQYPEKEKSIPNWASIINNFTNNMSIGNFVLTYDPSTRLYYTGKITGEYLYKKDVSLCHHIRTVKWNKETIPRDLLSNETKNSLGSTLTIFQLREEQNKEILNLMYKKKQLAVSPVEIKEENNENAKNLIENAKENLKDSLQSLDADEMEELVKEILNAMGYIAKRTKKGADRGVDIFASKDGLGLEEPRIFVEVKHRKGQMDSQAIRTFMGGRQQSDKCLYVSTGGYSKDARYEAERSSIPLNLIDIDDLANLISIHYDKFSAEGKALLPLKKVYIPIG